QYLLDRREVFLPSEVRLQMARKFAPQPRMSLRGLGIERRRHFLAQSKSINRKPLIKGAGSWQCFEDSPQIVTEKSDPSLTGGQVAHLPPQPAKSRERVSKCLHHA